MLGELEALYFRIAFFLFKKNHTNTNKANSYKFYLQLSVYTDELFQRANFFICNNEIIL